MAADGVVAADVSTTADVQTPVRD